MLDLTDEIPETLSVYRLKADETLDKFDASEAIMAARDERTARRRAWDNAEILGLNGSWVWLDPNSSTCEVI